MWILESNIWGKYRISILNDAYLYMIYEKIRGFHILLKAAKADCECLLYDRHALIYCVMCLAAKVNRSMPDFLRKMYQVAAVIQNGNARDGLRKPSESDKIEKSNSITGVEER